jgi:predicted acyl esterase
VQHHDHRHQGCTAQINAQRHRAQRRPRQRPAQPRPRQRREHNGGQQRAATDAPFARIVTETVVAALTETTTVATEVATEIVAHTAVAVESAAGTARELMTGGVGAVVKKAAGATVDIYQRATTQQLALAVTLADAVHVDWVSKLTRLNADAIAELVTASASAAHELLY